MISVARSMLLDVNLLCKSANFFCSANLRARVVKQASESWLLPLFSRPSPESLAMVWSGMLVIVSPGAMAFLKSGCVFFTPPILLLQQARATCILARDKDKRL